MTSERGFSLIEIIVAMAILSIVITAGAMAVTGNEQAGQRERVFANKEAIAKKAHSQLQGNMDARAACGRVWQVDERNAGSSSTVQVPYRVCNWPRSGGWELTDDDGRTYRIAAQLRAVDEPGDGTGRARALDGAGGGDADFNTRDRIDVSVSVTLAPDSIIGLSRDEAADTYVLRGRADWDTEEARGSVRVSVCILDRPDRSMASGRCVVNGADEDSPSQPANGVTVRLRSSGGASYTGTSTGGLVVFDGTIAEGTYRVSATNLPARTVVYKLSPKAITVSGADTQEATIYLAREGSTFEVCGRIRNPDNNGFGWKVTQTTLNWAAAGAPLRKGLRLNGMSEKWKCISPGLTDPLGYSARKLYRGTYLLEVAGVRGDLSVHSAQACSTGNDASWSLTAPPVTPSDTISKPTAALRRGLSLNSRDGATARLCIEFTSTAIPALDCVKGEPGCILISKKCNPGDCKPTTGCWNCGIIPVQADSAYKGNAIAGAHNGPNEQSIACRNDRTKGTYTTAWNTTAHAPFSTWKNRPFLGQTHWKLGNEGSAKHPDGRWNECPEISFTYTRSMTNICNSFSIGNPCTGPHKVSLGDCLEVKFRGQVVRGPVYDTFVAGQPSVGVMIGAWSRFIDHEIIREDRYYYAVPFWIDPVYGKAGNNVSPDWMVGWPKVKYRKVVDSVCQSSSVPPLKRDEITDIVPAEVVEVWKKPGANGVAAPVWPLPALAEVAPTNSTRTL